VFHFDCTSGTRLRPARGWEVIGADFVGRDPWSPFGPSVKKDTPGTSAGCGSDRNVTAESPEPNAPDPNGLLCERP